MLLVVSITEVLVAPAPLAFFSIFRPSYLSISLSLIRGRSLMLALSYDYPSPYKATLWSLVLATLEVLDIVRVRGALLMGLLDTFLFLFLRLCFRGLLILIRGFTFLNFAIALVEESSSPLRSGSSVCHPSVVAGIPFGRWSDNNSPFGW